MVRTLLSAPPTERVLRQPKHEFYVHHLPFVAQPMFMARVLPGETLQNLYLEARVVTDPILNPLIGWKQQFMFFYVKISQLGSDAIKDMFVDPTNAEIAGMDEAANIPRLYTGKGAINWAGKCLDAVMVAHFRDEGEAANAKTTAAGDYIVQVRKDNFMDSLTDKDLIPEGDAIAGATDAGDLDRLMDLYDMQRALGLANMDYEDWLRGMGIAIPDTEGDARPELLASFGSWQYPTNTIDPADGSPSSAVSWVFKNGAAKRKFFTEPGFIIGLSITRPKIYFGGLSGSALGWAQRPWDWMPSYMANYPETALKNFAADAGPLGERTTNTDAYWLDMRDELLYGDQFQNVHAFDADTADFDAYAYNMLQLPDNNLNWKYPAEADLKGLFVDAAGTAVNVKMDGYVGLSVKGAQVDYTVGNIAAM